MRGHPELFITISILSCYFIMCFVWIRMIYRIVERRQNLLLYLHSCGDILTYDSATEVWWSSWMSLHDCHVFPRIALMLCCNKHAAWGLVVFNAGATECERLEAGRLSEEDQNRTSESDRPHGLRDSLSLLLWQMWWMYSNGYYGLQMFAVPKIVQNCDDMGASGSRNFKWARVRPGSKHLRSLLDWCLKRSMFDQHVWPDSSFAPLRHFGCWMLCRPSWLMRTPRMKKTASVKRAKMRSISQTLVSLARLWMHDSHWFARCWITAASS